MSHRGRKRNIQQISTGRNPPPSNQTGAGGASTSASIANLLRNVNDPVTERANSQPENTSEYNLRNRTRSQNTAATTTTSSPTTPTPAEAASNATSGDSKTEEQPQCGICLDNITIQGVLNSCQHLFCFDCIDQWSKTSNTCPLCKRRFKELTKKDLSTPTKKAKKVKVKHTERRGRPDPDDDSYIDLEFLLSVLVPPTPHIMLSGLFPMLPRVSLFDRFLQSMQVPLFLLDGPGSGPLVDLTQEVIDLTNESDNEDDEDDVVVTSAPPQVNNNRNNNSAPPVIPVDPVDDDLEDFGNIPFLPEPRPASRRSSRRAAPQTTSSSSTGNTTTTTTTTFAFTFLPSMQQQPTMISDPFRRLDPLWPMQLPPPPPPPNFPLQFHHYHRQPYVPAAPPPPPTQPQHPAQPDARNRRGCPFNFHPPL